MAPDASSPRSASPRPGPAAPITHLRLDETSGRPGRATPWARIRKLDQHGSSPGPLANTRVHLDSMATTTTSQMGAVGTAKTIVLWLRADSYGVASNATGWRFPDHHG